MTLALFTLKLGLAAVLGALIGLERQYRQKSAGLRTNTLVATGSAAFVLLSASLTAGQDFGDPTRVAGQIVTGIGFLGAGVIMKTGLNIQGLNTAATICCSAATGTLAGAGLYWEAVILAAFILLSHLALRPLGLKLNRLPRIKSDDGTFYYNFKIRCKEQVENHLRVLILDAIKKGQFLQLRSLKSTDNGSPAFTYIEAEILANGRSDEEIELLAGKLTLEYGVTDVSWKINGEENMD
ncbi:MAG: MgtC/SapB family protein [Crocinitomicaceae bacterium]|nr:MgtC/SapB family protein [Crocinitomicaceae bacterium]